MKKVLIRTDAGLQIGNGHVIRMLALARELNNRKIPVCFAVRQDEFWLSRLANEGFEVLHLSDVENLKGVLTNGAFSHLIYDTRNDLTARQLREVKTATGVRVAVIDSPEETRLAADVVIFPPIPQIHQWSWESFEGQIFSGWEYALLRTEFVTAGRRHPGNTNKVLLSFGSTDPFHLTEWCLENIQQNRAQFGNVEFLLVVGPQFDRLQKVRELADGLDCNVSILQAPSNIVEVYRSVDYAFIALGVTAYELAALSVPFMFASISNDHAKSGEVFEKVGIGFPLGILNQSLDNFREKTGRFLEAKASIDQNVSQFLRSHKICDWTKIIQATVGQNTYA